MGLTARHPSGAQNFLVALDFFLKKKVCPLVYILITKALNYLASLCVTQLFPITTFFQLLTKLAGSVAKYP